MAKMREKVSKRNISLNIKTYEKLDKYKIKLMSEKENSKLSFDDIINDLLDRVSEDK
ncbi:MAG: hypothetical protein V1850_04650 [Candidatus Bathyarchaeota archaeon]